MLKNLLSTVAKEISWHSVDIPIADETDIVSHHSEIQIWLIKSLGYEGSIWKIIHEQSLTRILFKNKEDAVWFKTVWY